jgi:lanosterol synthase
VDGERRDENGIEVILTIQNGTNGSQLWDTAFVVQAMVESGLAQEPEFHEPMNHAHSFIDSMQVCT